MGSDLESYSNPLMKIVPVFPKHYSEHGVASICGIWCWIEASYSYIYCQQHHLGLLCSQPKQYVWYSHGNRQKNTLQIFRLIFFAHTLYRPIVCERNSLFAYICSVRFCHVTRLVKCTNTLILQPFIELFEQQIG